MSTHPPTTTAICLALAAGDQSGPACLLTAGDRTLLARLVEQLRRAGAGRVIVLTRPEWQQSCVDALDAWVEVEGHAAVSDLLARIATVADDTTGDLLVTHADVLTHDGAIDGLVADPRVRSGVLSTTKPTPGLLCPRLRISRGRVVASESGYHRVEAHNSYLLSVCKIGRPDLGEAAAAARELSGLTASGLPDGWADELADKITERGAAVLTARAGRYALATQLAEIADPPPGFPDAARLREELAAAYRVEVSAPAEALRDDPLPMLVVGLIRRDVMMTTTYLRDLYWERPLSAARAANAHDEMAMVDEDEVLLDSAVKATDGFFTTFFVSTYSRYIARWAAHRGLTPNQVTTVSMLLGLLAAAAFATGRPAGMVAGAVLLQIAFTADCVDGQLARYSRQFSKLGAWLDSVFDRGKEYVVYAGLAIGATATGAGAEIWFLAAAALALQTFRHYIDFSYAAQQHQALAAAVRGSLKAPDETEVTSWEGPVTTTMAGASVLQRLGRSGIKTSVAFERQPWMKWAKRIIVLPIGERFALISLTAALSGPRTTFLALLIWGAVAAAYTTTGRVLRSFA